MSYQIALLDGLEKGDREGFSKVIVPWNPEDFPLDKLRNDYAFVRFPGGQPSQLPENRRFVPDRPGHFFMLHGGFSILENDNSRLTGSARQDYLRYSGNLHLTDPRKMVLDGQPDDGLVSIVVGKLPAFERGSYDFKSGEWKPWETVTDSVYLYAEGGERNKPKTAHPIRGNEAISEEMPILYLLEPFSETAPIRATFDATIRILVPRSHIIRQYPS